MLAAALLLATTTAGAPRTPASSGLFPTSQITVRVVVVDRCTVSPSGAACEGVAPIKPLDVGRARAAMRIDIVF
jgi:hypothetical protein